jgi:hypothetical protein
MQSSSPRPDPAPAGHGEPVVKLFTEQRIGDIARAAYGGAAAVLQDDRAGSDMMLRDLAALCDDSTEALWAVAILTLERIGAASEASPVDDTAAMANSIIERADAFCGSTLAVNAAARRIDALRSGDLAAFAAASVGLEAIASEMELLAGAIALLTASLWWSADVVGRRPDDVCRELCTAAMLAGDN